jgi:hypothetical protein
MSLLHFLSIGRLPFLKMNSSYKIQIELIMMMVEETIKIVALTISNLFRETFFLIN